MKFDILLLKEKLDKYFSGALSNVELGEWAKEAYINILQGGSLEISKIALYPFLQTISKLHIDNNDIEDVFPSSVEEVKEIQKIIQGEIDVEFFVEIRIPIKMADYLKMGLFLDNKKIQLFAELKKQITQYRNTCDSSVINCDLFKQIVNLHYNIETIQGRLEKNIIELLNCNFFIDYNVVITKNVRRLYSKESFRDIVTDKLLSLLECYLGNKNFFILVSFQRGLYKIKFIL